MHVQLPLKWELGPLLNERDLENALLFCLCLKLRCQIQASMVSVSIAHAFSLVVVVMVFHGGLTFGPRLSWPKV